MSRHRSFVHVAGPPSGGKTTLIERLLVSNRSRLLTVVRGHAVLDLRRATETSKGADPELKRYAAAGASDAVRYRFPNGPDASESFWHTEFLQGYSQGVVIEGDLPTGVFTELVVSVASPLTRGRLLEPVSQGSLRETKTSGDSDVERLKAMIQKSLGHPSLLGPAAFEGMVSRRAIERGLTPPQERWRIGGGLDGIERAGLVVINARSEAERVAAELMTEDLRRIRKDDAVREDVLGIFGRRTPVTVCTADLANPRDPGLRKALTRLKRAFSTPFENLGS